MELRLFSRFRIDILLVSPSVDVLKRVVQISERFKLTYFRVSEILEYQQGFTEIGRPNLIILDVTHFPNRLQVDNQVNEIKNFLPKCEILCIVNESTHKEYIKKIKDDGVKQVMSLQEVLNSSRLDFLIYHQFMLAYYPIESKDLFPSTEISFTGYHFLKLNNKYLPVVFRNFVLSDKKFKKLEKIPKLFVDIEEASLYKAYIEKYYDTFNIGLWRRIKASYLKFIAICRQFNQLLVYSHEEDADDQLEAIVQDGGKSLQEFINYVNSSKDPLFFFYQTYAENPVLEFDRTSLILGMAALIAAKSGVADPTNVLRVGLFTYAGIPAMSNVHYLRWTGASDEKWSDDEKKQFVLFLDYSRELAKSRLKKFKEKTQLVAPLFECFDGQGMPGKLKGNDIHPETALLQFVERWLSRFFEKGMITSEELNESFLSCCAQDKASGRIDPEFIAKLENIDFLKVAA